MLTLSHFDSTSTLVAADDDPLVFRADLDPSWASLRGVHGGYMTALAVRAAEAIAPDRSVRTVTTAFLRPAEVGPVDLSVDVIRSGRSLTTLSTMITQQERSIATSRITSIAPVAGHDWQTTVDDRPIDLDGSVQFTPPPQIRHFEQAQLRLDPATVPIGDGSHPRVAGHVRPNDMRKVDAAWLAMIGDWFPPSPFRRVGPPIGGVSIDYTIHIHRVVDLADDEWLEGVFETANSFDGLALEHGVLSTPAGLAVAETFHTRWTG